MMPHPYSLVALKALIKQWLLQIFFSAVPRHIFALKQNPMGLNLIGYFQGDLGLGQALRYIAKAVEAASIPFLVRRFTAPLQSSQSNHSLDPFLASYCQYPVNLITVNPDLLYRLPTWVSYSEWAKRYNIGYWFWELEKFPDRWRYALHLIDEIWVNTEFVANAMRKVHPKVFKIPFAVEFKTPNAKYTKSYFGLPPSSFIFLTSFDFQSSIARKNPQAVIEAFLQAFPKPNHNAYLVIKSTNRHLHPVIFEQLTLKTQKSPHIFWMDQQLSSEAMQGLLQCADCYVSLHRSEGLGLGMAESMYLGKPVIATAYSGNLEFMKHENSCLVSYQTIEVCQGQYHDEQNQVWADANIDEAAHYMKKVFDDSQFRAQLGLAAQQWMLEHHSYKRMGAAIADRLDAIRETTLC